MSSRTLILIGALAASLAGCRHASGDGKQGAATTPDVQQLQQPETPPAATPSAATPAPGASEEKPAAGTEGATGTPGEGAGSGDKAGSDERSAAKAAPSSETPAATEE